MDSIIQKGKQVASSSQLVATTSGHEYVSSIEKVSIERQSKIDAVIKIEGTHSDGRRH